MVKKLNVTVGQIWGAIINISSFFEQLSIVTEQSSLGEKEQKSETVQITTAMVEIAATAQRTQESTLQIKALIEKLQSGAKSAVESMTLAKQHAQLNKHKIGLITLRCAGFNNVDIQAAKKLNISITRVPAYSPEAVAEHTLALMLTLIRKTHKAYYRVKENNFDLNGLLGFNLHGKTIGVIGVSRIDKAFLRMMTGFGCELIYDDPYEQTELAKKSL